MTGIAKSVWKAWMTSHQAAVDLLKANIGHIPSVEPDIPHITLFPWSVEGPEVDALADLVCRSVVQLFVDAGYPMVIDRTAAEPNRAIQVKCRQCSTPLIDTTVGQDGIAMVPGPQVIAGLSQRRLECPHGIATLEDQRRLIEDAVNG